MLSKAEDIHNKTDNKIIEPHFPRIKCRPSLHGWDPEEKELIIIINVHLLILLSEFRSIHP